MGFCHSAGAVKAFTIPWVRELIEQISKYLRENAEWIGIPSQEATKDRAIKLLDYACGNGTVSMVSQSES